MSKMKSLVKQFVDLLMAMIAFGQSKFNDKKKNNGKPAREKIYSRSTLETYQRVAYGFAHWVKAAHGCRYACEARKHIPEYLQMRIDKGLSAWTIKKEASALAKVYQCSYTEFGIKFPQCKRKNRKLHRTNAWVGRFSLERNADLVAFCLGTGLRRHEVAMLMTCDVYRDASGKVIVHVRQGKGGKERYVEALNDKPLELAERAVAEGRTLIFPHIHSHAPIHAMRGEYARTLYAQLARPLEEIPREERYICRAEKKGTIYDKKAMRIVSLMLGHNRLCVVTNYLD